MVNHINKNVLITGISGFTGMHIENYLQRNGFNVYGTTFSKPLKSNHFKCDILNQEELLRVVSRIKPNYVIHLAAISFVATHDVPIIYETNVQGTLNLLDSVLGLDYKIEKIIVASSAAVYGNIGTVLSEEMCPKPINHYGNSKLAMENMVANYFDKLDIVISRPFNYTGVGQEEHFLVPKIVKHFKEREKVIELGNINTYREYNDVQFLVENYYKLLLGEYKSGVVNICSGNTYSINDILNVMKDLSNHNIEVKINEKFVRKNEIVELKGDSQKLNSVVKTTSNLSNTLKNTLEVMYLS